jgi:hypothetical protein
MNLIQIREKFRTLSGRFDLVGATPTFIDNGANFFINEGRKYLDRLDETQKSWGQYFRLLAIGQYSTTFPYCRALKEIWAATSTERWQLEKMDLQDLISGYLTNLPSARTPGTPLYYAPCISRYVPEDAAVGTLEAFSGFVDIPSGDAHNYNAIILDVPVDVQTMLDMRGLFYSMELVDDTDKNYWSEVHPSLLIQAAMREVEIFNRNTQGVNDWSSAIAAQMTQLGYDLVEELIAEVTEMEG